MKGKKTTTMTTIKRQFLVPRARLQLKTTPPKKLPEISLPAIKEYLEAFFSKFFHSLRLSTTVQK